MLYFILHRLDITKELFVFIFIVVFFVFVLVNTSPDVVTVLDLRQEPSNQLGREHPRIELREQKITNNLNKEKYEKHDSIPG